jgi:predicted hydrocarbon binding protein
MADKTVGNIVIRLTLDASEEVLGANGLKAILNLSKMSHLLENRPDYSFEKNYTDEEFRAISSSYVDVLGIDGARAVFRMIGKTIGKNTIKIGGYESIKDSDPEERLLKAIELYAVVSGRGKVSREGGVIVYDNPQCTLCAHAKHDHPICSLYNGYLDVTIEWSGVKGKKSVETACMAMGDSSCRFEILSLE